ncbi:MAG: hypothetical protein MZV63_02875 [Marinilabiliales bacterium]|nr:hypothetical protein [Marinilabiliales bacterium]
MRLKNYQAAMNSLEKITTKDNRLKEAYQKVAYYRGIELFRNKKLPGCCGNIRQVADV